MPSLTDHVWNMEKGNLVPILIMLTDPAQMRLTELNKCKFKKALCAVMHTVHVNLWLFLTWKLAHVWMQMTPKPLPNLIQAFC